MESEAATAETERPAKGEAMTTDFTAKARRTRRTAHQGDDGADLQNAECRAQSAEQTEEELPRLSDLQRDPEGGIGIVCRKCGGTHFEVAYTRKRNGRIERARDCRHCGRRVFTKEEPI
jgi:hypothetical protein